MLLHQLRLQISQKLESSLGYNIELSHNAKLETGAKCQVCENVKSW